MGRWAAAVGFVLLAGPAAADDAAVARGEYVLRAAGCVACHTDIANDGDWLAGGAPLKTPFGTFHAPNITSDETHGIGGWTEADLARALGEGTGPGGVHYYPVFPYTTYTRMAADDIADLWAYLESVPASKTPRIPHDLKFPFNFRLVNWVWKLLFFSPGPLPAAADQADDWRRGRYLTEALGHCGECHTPRNMFGAAKASMHQAGTLDGPEGKKVPNITPDDETGIGEWSEGDIAWLLQTGFRPDGNDVQGTMAEVVEESSSHLTVEDRTAIAVYLKSLAPIRNQIRPPREDDDAGDNW